MRDVTPESIRYGRSALVCVPVPIALCVYLSSLPGQPACGLRSHAPVHEYADDAVGQTLGSCDREDENCEEAVEKGGACRDQRSEEWQMRHWFDRSDAEEESAAAAVAAVDRSAAVKVPRPADARRLVCRPLILPDLGALFAFPPDPFSCPCFPRAVRRPRSPASERRSWAPDGDRATTTRTTNGDLRQHHARRENDCLDDEPENEETTAFCSRREEWPREAA